MGEEVMDEEPIEEQPIVIEDSEPQVIEAMDETIEAVDIPKFPCESEVAKAVTEEKSAVEALPEPEAPVVPENPVEAPADLEVKAKPLTKTIRKKRRSKKRVTRRKK